ncbi:MULTISPECIES: ATP-grasp domain-containing protein [unclassified Streptomyces]|uniref:ATP-grasp domain-containing protein n=1 Tax=unclassified Streptomyces TaxID=2593676 RepID=UPI0033286548
MTPPAPRPVLLLLSGSRRVVDKALSLGLDVVHLQAPTLADPSLDPLCLRTVRIDLLDVPGVVAVARLLHQEFGFAGVCSNHEPACTAAEAVALDLGLVAPGTGVAALLRDKARTHEVLDKDPSLRTPWARLNSPEDALRVADTAGWPLVLKPVDGSASLGVLKVDGPDGLDDAWQRVKAVLGNSHHYHEVLPVTGYLVEPFAPGEEFSVETFSTAGIHEVRAVVRKLVGGSFVETGHLVPAELDGERHRAVVDRVVAFLDHVGLREGPAHTEVIVGEQGIHLVESHARTGGDEIPALLTLVTGRDVEADMLAHACGVPLPPAVAPLGAAAVKRYLLADRAGRVTAVDGAAEAAGVPGVHSVRIWTSPGDIVRPATASWERLGEVVAVGSDTAAAASAAERACRAITLRMEEQ